MDIKLMYKISAFYIWAKSSWIILLKADTFSVAKKKKRHKNMWNFYEKTFKHF